MIDVLINEPRWPDLEKRVKSLFKGNKTRSIITHDGGRLDVLYTMLLVMDQKTAARNEEMKKISKQEVIDFLNENLVNVKEEMIETIVYRTKESFYKKDIVFTEEEQQSLAKELRLTNDISTLAQKWVSR